MDENGPLSLLTYLFKMVKFQFANCGDPLPTSEVPGVAPGLEQRKVFRCPRRCCGTWGFHADSSARSRSWQRKGPKGGITCHRYNMHQRAMSPITSYNFTMVKYIYLELELHPQISCCQHFSIDPVNGCKSTKVEIQRRACQHGDAAVHVFFPQVYSNEMQIPRLCVNSFRIIQVTPWSAAQSLLIVLGVKLDPCESAKRIADDRTVCTGRDGCSVFRAMKDQLNSFSACETVGSPSLSLKQSGKNKTFKRPNKTIQNMH
jgi:hypothetical protein